MNTEDRRFIGFGVSLLIIFVASGIAFLALLNAFGGFMKNEMATAQDLQVKATEVFTLVREDQQVRKKWLSDLKNSMEEIVRKLEESRQNHEKTISRIEEELAGLRIEMEKIPEVKHSSMELRIEKIEAKLRTEPVELEKK